MKTVYWEGRDGEMLQANVPDEAVAFGIGAECPIDGESCVITTIINNPNKTYRCSNRHEVLFHDHIGHPPVTMERRGYQLLVIDRQHDHKVVVVTGVPV